ncbi:MAG: hypothetical protein LBH55_03895 [Mycoplasmataceae bacterium]|nr:hypothetical protein [Mycoplasmataceae bacterium]
MKNPLKNIKKYFNFDLQFKLLIAAMFTMLVGIAVCWIVVATTNTYAIFYLALFNFASGGLLIWSFCANLSNNSFRKYHLAQNLLLINFFSYILVLFAYIFSFVYQTAAENGALVTFSTYGINVIFLIEFLVSLGFILISIIIYTITDYKINQKLLIWKKNKEEEKKLEMENGTPK